MDSSSYLPLPPPCRRRRRGRAQASLGAAALALWLLSALPALAADEAPPPLPPESSAPSPSSAAPGGPVDDTDPMNPVLLHRDTSKVKSDVTIEQRRIGRRVAELVVTPAGFTYNYTMDHLDGFDPASVLQPHPELSTPRFIRFDFNF
jgi:hypothetical protein